jgi:predicted lipid carrier protein YhbT
VRADPPRVGEGEIVAHSIEEFFAELGRRGHEPLVEKATGTMRFDVVRGRRTDHWIVGVKNGDIEVLHQDGEADCVLAADHTLFDGIARGRQSTMAAVLRGALMVSGDPELLVLGQRLFPGRQQ